MSFGISETLDMKLKINIVQGGRAEQTVEKLVQKAPLPSQYTAVGQCVGLSSQSEGGARALTSDNSFTSPFQLTVRLVSTSLRRAGSIAGVNVTPLGTVYRSESAWDVVLGLGLTSIIRATSFEQTDENSSAELPILILSVSMWGCKC